MAFTITTINQANQFAKFVEDLTIPDSAGATVAEVFSSIIDTELPVKHKFLVELEVTEASGADGAADVEIQGSMDQTNWVNLDVSLGMTLDTSTLGTARAFADLADQSTPYYRFRIFTDGTDILDSADVTLRFAVQTAHTERRYPRR